MMTFLLQLKFRSRLLLLLAAPLLGLLFFSANRVLDKFAVLEGVKVLHASADLSVKLSRTIHELQKERGMSSGFLASRGEKFRAELGPQRAATDQTMGDLQAHLAGTALPAALNENLAPLRDLMQAQPALRTRIDALDMAPKDSFAAYTRFIEAGLEVVATIARQSNHEELSRQASAYLMFLNAKEYAGRERATLNGVFAQKRFDAESYRRIIAILSAQDAYFKEFGHYAAPAQKAALDGVQQASAAQDVARMRKEALERGLEGEQNTDPGTWFKTITAKINALKGVEDQLSGHLLATLGVIERDARWSFTIALVLTAVTLALSLILSGLIIASLLRELGGEPSYAASVARTIASGDLSAQIAARDGDAHSVVAAIGQMQANLREMIGRVVDIADNIAVSSAQLNSVSADVATRAGHESDAASSIAATTEQLTTIIHQLSSNGEQIHQKTVGTGQLAGSGRNVVETATAQMNELAEMVQRFSESVKELGEQSAHISTIVQTIREIADQTNLLALNAAIEAARAGETGRGFAVVADEVRKLAERTTHATVEIGQTIKVIQTGMNAAVENMTQANSKVGSSAAEVNKAGESMRAIHQAAEQVIRDIGEISDALREQSSASMDLANQAGNIANISHANSVAVEQVSTSSRDLDGLARELKQSVGKFRLA